MARGVAAFTGSGPVWVTKTRRLRMKQPGGFYAHGWGPRVVAGYIEATMAGGVRIRARGGRPPIAADRLDFLGAIFALEKATRAA